MTVAYRHLAHSLVVLSLAATSLAACGLGREVGREIEREITFNPSRDDSFGAPPGTEDTWFTASDGVQLHGWLLRTRPRPSRGAILYFHGNSGSVQTYLETAERLRRSGFDVMLWDYRGYGKSGGELEDEAALYRDGHAAVAAFARLTGVRPQRQIMFGYSLGTAVATQMAIDHGCRALALQAPIASLRSQIRENVPIVPNAVFRRMQNRFDTRSKIGALECPLLVIHGDRDETVSLAQGLAVYEAAPQPKQLKIVPHGGHVLGAQAGWPEVNEVVRFVAQTAR